MGLGSSGRLGRVASWLAPLAAIAFIGAMFWLRQQSPAAARLLGALGLMFVASCGVFLVLRQQRRMDEVHLASQGFANTYGWIWGGVATTLLLLVPAVMDWLVGLVNAMAKRQGANNSLAVQLAFFYGAALVMVIQGLAVSIASVIWWRRMGGLGAKS